MATQITRSDHYTTLDGLRGFAALSVLAFHLGRWLDIPWLCANGNLSVDTFFCLSGYVLPLAYGRKIATLSMGDFIVTRLIRLMPMIVLSVAVSAPYVFFRSFVSHIDVSAAAIFSAALLGALNLPYFYAPSGVGGPQLFPLNGPQYSLFLEVMANIVWWATRYLPQMALAAAVAVVSAAILVHIGIGGDTTETFWYGFPHVGASFALGVFIYHLDRKLPFWRGWTPLFWGVVIAMIAIFFAPYEASFAVKLAWKLFLSPLLVIAGAHVQFGKTIDSFFLRIGALSYPLYALHYPLFCWINGTYRMLLGSRDVWIEAPLIFVIVIGLSYLGLRAYDEPVRSYLSRKLLSPRPKAIVPAE
ncbi:acyltransferase [Bradyrhizobium sp. dw_78]|uniref:acyltransferase family protein n=1 Tax=Bradyrhizobium sp. dw_78 TaxID=2719793 RepID=UPI001BD64F0A|nr:acyltransferase [Bradyrhizobium sp. dw_78]